MSVYAVTGTTLHRSTSTDGSTWHTTAEPLPATTRPLPGDAQLVLFGDLLGALLRDGATLVTQPALTVSWIGGVRAGDGSWWVGGSAGGHPAVAVTRDGGGSWTVTPFPGAGTARVALLGRDVHVALTDPATNPPRLTGVAWSSDGGATFGAVTPVAAGMIGGDLVPLVDGRLVIVDGLGHWLASADHGATWQRLTGLHPTDRLVRSPSGWLAFGMSTIYTAFSADGATWQKLNAT